MARLDESAKGVFIISVTPFAEDGRLDLESTDRLVEFYQGHGVDGITILGIMGEAPKLTHDEAVAFARRVLARTDRPVIVGVSSAGLVPLATLTRAVMDAGAAGVMIAPPGHLRTDAEIRRYYAQAVEAIGDDVPWVLQDFPFGTGVKMDVGVIATIAREHPSCVMLKHEDWPGLAKISALRALESEGLRRLSILVGNGGIFLPEELARGADGAMTGFAWPEMLVEVCRLHTAGEHERACDLFDAYLPLVRLEQQPGLGLAIRKQVLFERGAIASPTLRPPGPGLDSRDLGELHHLQTRLARALERLG